MDIKILGTGCANCKKLEANAKKAVDMLKANATITKVEDMKDIMSYGVMRTPALVINDKIKMYGKVSTVAEIEGYLKEEDSSL